MADGRSLPLRQRAREARRRRAGGAGLCAQRQALRAVQPEDVLPGDIDANLGAPWIPETDIGRLPPKLFSVPPR